MLSGYTTGAIFGGLNPSSVPAGQPVELTFLGVGPVTIRNQDAASTSANRITTPTGKDILLPPGQKPTARLVRNSTTGWLLQTGSVTVVRDITPQDFGAAGDGVTDDTAAIEAAVAYLTSIGGGKLFFPPGTYVTSADIALPNNSEVHGAGRVSTAILRKNTSAQVLSNLSMGHVIYHPTQGAGNGVNNCDIHGLSLHNAFWQGLPGAAASLWAPSTAYTVGHIVVPRAASCRAYVCTTAGTSGSFVPVGGKMFRSLSNQTGPAYSPDVTLTGTTTDNFDSKGAGGLGKNIIISLQAAAHSTTIASGSNGVTLPQSTISVASTAGFPSSGTVFIQEQIYGWVSVAYTGLSGGNTLTGCTGGTGALATGMPVQQEATLFQYSVDGTTFNGTNIAIPSGSTFTIPGTGLTANFPAGHYLPSDAYASPTFGFSMILGSVITDGSVQWTCVDGGSGYLNIQGGSVTLSDCEIYAGTGVIFDQTEVSAVKRCRITGDVGVWLTNGNGRVGTPQGTPAGGDGGGVNGYVTPQDTNVINVEECDFYAACGIADQGGVSHKFDKCDVNGGEIPLWVTDVQELHVAMLYTEGSYPIGVRTSWMPFIGLSLVGNTGATFDCCLLGGTIGCFSALPSYTLGEVPNVQSCTLSGAYGVVGCNLLRPSQWGPNEEFFSSGVFDTAFALGVVKYYQPLAGLGVGVVPLASIDTLYGMAARTYGLTLASGVNSAMNWTHVSNAYIVGTGLILTGWSDFSDGLERDIVFASPATLNHEDTVNESAAVNRIHSPTGQNLVGITSVRLRYTASVLNRWSVLAYGGTSGGVRTVATTTAYTFDSSGPIDNTVLTSLGAAASITLPAPTPGRVLRVKDAAGSAATKNVTIAPHASETIDGASSYVLTINRACVELTSDGTNWFVTGEYNGTVI